jgi:hypothetical protein
MSVRNKIICAVYFIGLSMTARMFKCTGADMCILCNGSTNLASNVCEICMLATCRGLVGSSKNTPRMKFTSRRWNVANIPLQAATFRGPEKIKICQRCGLIVKKSMQHEYTDCRVDYVVDYNSRNDFVSKWSCYHCNRSCYQVGGSGGKDTCSTCRFNAKEVIVALSNSTPCTRSIKCLVGSPGQIEHFLDIFTRCWLRFKKNIEVEKGKTIKHLEDRLRRIFDKFLEMRHVLVRRCVKCAKLCFSEEFREVQWEYSVLEQLPYAGKCKACLPSQLNYLTTCTYVPINKNTC